MGYFSCNAESAIATCDSYNWPNLTKKNRTHKKPFKIREFSYPDLHSATNAFSQDNLLGKGSHGYVYKAHLHQNKLNTVAVKKTKQTESRNSSANSPAENEIEILSRVHHPRLVNLLGYAVDNNQNKLIVVEFMPHGSLYELLHSSSKPPNWARRVRFALQIAKGVHFLHCSNPPVIHRDIKSSNILIDGNFSARLGDFGLSLRGHVEDVIVKSTPPAGTLGYLDPAYLAPGDLSTKSDVFSFGILVLEIISGRNAIDVNYSPPSVVDWAVPLIKSGEYAEICDPRIGSPEDDGVLRQLAVVAARCVRKTAGKRPAMAEVVEWLKMVHKRMSSPIWNNIGRRVGRVRESTRLVNYEPLDDSMEIVKISRVGSRRNRKVSNVTSVELRSVVIGGNRKQEIQPAIRSKSIGSLDEIESEPLDLANTRRKGGLAVKMSTVRLSKSRSMGMIQSSTRLMNKNNSSNGVVVKFVKKPNGKELEESKLLVNVGKESQRGG
ncbi:PREDICTED: serine/threonine-protein kinase-like protein At3g51990 [Nicotiana attenuata]|uniref:Serinethreonine-protein kinase-like protein n=1 Tax=Nicotiana attenuata TaxID=49451 RepID=A0A314LCG9_NICAT|nr:PREDICTED: serine/threonine-protein kinase-like protein At3g51990 [Nicotiana attenuata]OIT38847.1 serinethreonine-protein kinase-like protein [Nicotiana attenuata]